MAQIKQGESGGWVGVGGLGRGGRGWGRSEGIQPLSFITFK